MSILLDPVELGFRRPFNHEVSETLRLKNPHSDPLAFKVKTTAPKQYCVRPNSGRIEPGDQVEVQVLLQAMKEDPPLETKCRDKFLVQSVAIPAEQDASNWTGIEQVAKSSIQERKIRVNFLPAAGSGALTPPRDASVLNDDHPPAYSSPDSKITTPVGAISKPESRPNGAKNLGDAINSAGNPATSSSAGASIPTSSDELKMQLQDAKHQIQTLTKQVQDQSGLRQRKADGSSSGKEGSSMTATAMQNAPPAGVQVPLVAGLCLLSFLLAYLFF
ncbi:MAG: phosphatidylinositol-binding protein scs2 [Alyxoria varia]|nr:MAG: phosphatidylinositol-binding protein scs2 [Alyxoria varia]